jgi:5-methylthioadenosine/S-adenosylhomocysteine deaminase
VATHLGETGAEGEYLIRGEGPLAPFAEFLVEPYGTTAIRALAARGLLTPKLVAAHCVTVDEEEIALLAEHGSAVAHCPRSNALLGCGIAPVEELLAAGVRVGLGTDSPASTPSFDMFEELRAAVYAARLRARRPDAMPAALALELATLGSARALGLDEEIGSLEPGKRADLTVLSFAGSPFLPWEDPAAAVVLGGSPSRVSTTYVEGKLRYSAGSFEWRELRQTGINARNRLLKSSRSSSVP